MVELAGMTYDSDLHFFAYIHHILIPRLISQSAYSLIDLIAHARRSLAYFLLPRGGFLVLYTNYHIRRGCEKRASTDIKGCGWGVGWW